MKSVLFINYYFPPIGGSGVQRALKFIKYLPTFGWKPTVITVKDVIYHAYDPTLLAELPADLNVIRTESLDPLRLAYHLNRGKLADASQRKQSAQKYREGSFIRTIYRNVRNMTMFPDGYIGWIPFAKRAGMKAIRENKPDVIFATCGPYSSGLVAVELSKRTGIPCVIDFRDGWLDDPYLPAPSGLHRAIHARFEKRVLMAASGVTVYGEFLKKKFQGRYPHLRRDPIVIPNGFDPADLATISPLRAPTGKRRIVYSGTLYAHQRPNLRAFFEAFKSLPSGLQSRIEIFFVGQTYEGAKGDAGDYGVDAQFLGYQKHSEALRYLAGADAGLLFVRPGDISSATGKVFEYIGLKIPILSTFELNGEAARILRKAGRDRWLAAPVDVTTIARHIQALEASGWPSESAEGAAAYNRFEHTRELASLMDDISTPKQT